ncbi:MAG: hypothetical protein SFU91_11400 [Chloroherpetonaceae bacterium]|nr:hypothetical protein [Chloroherpetonaceae bacterium]
MTSFTIRWFRQAAATSFRCMQDSGRALLAGMTSFRLCALCDIPLWPLWLPLQKHLSATRWFRQAQPPLVCLNFQSFRTEPSEVRNLGRAESRRFLAALEMTHSNEGRAGFRTRFACRNDMLRVSGSRYGGFERLNHLEVRRAESLRFLAALKMTHSNEGRAGFRTRFACRNDMQRVSGSRYGGFDRLNHLEVRRAESLRFLAALEMTR